MVAPSSSTKLASYQHPRKRVFAIYPRRRNSSHWIGREFERKRPSHLCNAPKLARAENTDAFRRDLFHRINVLRLELPPLRERGDDIQGLTNWLIKRVSSRLECERSLYLKKQGMH